MTLRNHVEAGLATLRSAAPLSLDEEGACEIPIRLPPSLAKIAGGRILIRIKVARTGNFFTLLSPIGQAAKEPPPFVLATLLADQFFVDQVGAASYSYNTETGIIFATYHWMLEAITPAQLSELVEKFSAATFLLLER